MVEAQSLINFYAQIFKSEFYINMHVHVVACVRQPYILGPLLNVGPLDLVPNCHSVC